MDPREHQRLRRRSRAGDDLWPGLEELCNTIGRPSSSVEFRIVGDDGRECEVGEHGELQFRAGFLFSGYLQGATVSCAAYTSDCWLKTGDLGFLRPDGNLTLVGRKSETYKSGGYNVYPREIELVLEAHPSVSMAAVVALPDETYQEVGAAFVVPARGRAADEVASELKLFCAENLANYKVPKHFMVAEDLPTLPVGKIDKVELKRRIHEPKGDD